MSVFGLDIGGSGATACVVKGGSIDTCLNEASKRKTPPLVSFAQGQRYLGEPASALVSSNYQNTIKELKRFIGRSWSDPELQRDIARQPNASRFSQGPDDTVRVEVTKSDGTKLNLDMTAVMGMYIGGVKRCSERWLSDNSGSNVPIYVRDAVVSVPAFFTDNQRRCLLDACRIGGLNVLRLINDQTAVALDYGMWKNARNVFDPVKPTLVLFVDVGYAEASATVVSYVKGKFTVSSCAHDRDLGGRDIDDALAASFAEEFLKKSKLDARKDAKAMIKLRAAAEKAKQTLTPEGLKKAEVSVEYLLQETDFKTMVTIEQLDEIVAPLAKRVEGLVTRALAEAQVTMADISAVELVGGTTRMRQFKKAVASVCQLPNSDKPPNFGILTTLNTEESTARGCALACAMLSPQFKIAATFEVDEKVLLPIRLSWDQTPSAAAPPAVEANPDAMEVEEANVPAASGVGVTVFKRTDATPWSRRVTFKRAEPFEIRASYDDPIPETALPAKAPRTIATFHVSGMPKDADKKGKIGVTFTHDKSGVLRCSSAQYIEVTDEEAAAAAAPAADGAAEKKKKTVKTELVVVSTYLHSPTEAQMASMLATEAELTKVDSALRERADKRNQLEECIYSTRGKLDDELKAFATEKEAANLKARLEAEEAWLYSEQGEEADTQVMDNRLVDLKGQIHKITERSRQIELRKEASDRLSARVQEFLGVANSVEEQYNHLADEERAKVRAACDEALTWLTRSMEEQGALPLHADPVLLASAIDDRAVSLRDVCRPIVTKPRPKAPKADPPATATPPPADAPAADAPAPEAGEKKKKSDDDMDLD